MKFVNHKGWPKNFMGVDEKFFKYENSGFVILPVPYEGTVTYGRGTSKGPNAIIQASRQVEWFDEELHKETALAGIHTLKGIESKKNPDEVIMQVYAELKKHKNKFVVVLGGEHSISLAEAKAYKERYNDLSVLQLDAHSDLRESFEGSKFNHACVMARIREICPAVQVGIRSLCSDCMKKIKKNDYPVFFAKDIYDNNKWFDKAISKLSKNVFITIDLDVFDPSVMPSVGTPEPGGLSYYQVLSFLKEVFKRKNVVGFDVVEFSPIKEIHAPDFMAAKLIYKLIGYKNLYKYSHD